MYLPYLFYLNHKPNTGICVMSLPIPNEFWKKCFEAPDPAYDECAARERLAHIREYAVMAHFTQEELAQLEGPVAALSANSELLHFWDLMIRTILQPGVPGGDAAGQSNYLPDDYDVITPDAFTLLVDLACIPHMAELYKQRGWYELAFDEALLDIRIWMEFNQANRGRFGILFGHAWLRSQFDGLVIRLGRLQCNTSSGFFSCFRVFRNNTTGETVTFVNSEVSVTDGGLTALEDDPVRFTTAKVAEDGDTFTGWTVGENGRVNSEPVTISGKDWTEYLKAGDPAVNLHIPADGPMKPEACMDSFRRMKAFFKDIMGVEVKVFQCESWLLDPRFCDLLPESSNILAFQRFGKLLPWPGKGQSEMIRRVFGTKAMEEGVNSVPHITTMQKIFAASVNAGEKFRNGAFFIDADIV